MATKSALFTVLHRFSQPFEGNLADYDLVILHELPVLSPWWLSRVSQYKQEGGRVLIIPPSQGRYPRICDFIGRLAEGRRSKAVFFAGHRLFFAFLFLGISRKAFACGFAECTRFICGTFFGFAGAYAFGKRQVPLGWYVRRQGQARRGFAMRFFLLCAGRIRIWRIIRCLFL